MPRPPQGLFMIDTEEVERISTALSDLAGQWQVLESRVVAAKNALATLCVANPLRWALWVNVPASSQGTLVNFGIGTNPALVNTIAPDLSVHPVGSGIVYRQWGGFVQQAFYGWYFGTAVNITATIVEVVCVP